MRLEFLADFWENRGVAWKNAPKSMGN